MRSKNIRTCSSIIFLNQEINPTTTSNLESKSQPIIKEHEHQTYKKKKKKKHEHHQIKEHEQEQTQENPHETTPKPIHLKNRNPTKHPTHPLPNQTIIKEILNTTTS